MRRSRMRSSSPSPRRSRSSIRKPKACSDSPPTVMSDHRASRGELRPGEVAVGHDAAPGAELYFIGRIATPWKTREECPRRGDLAGPVCRVEVDEPWRAALAGI